MRILCVCYLCGGAVFFCGSFYSYDHFESRHLNLLLVKVLTPESGVKITCDPDQNGI